MEYWYINFTKIPECSGGTPLGNITPFNLDDNSFIQAHRYVLRHCDNLECYRHCFKDEEKRKRRGHTHLTISDLERLMNERFHEWLRDTVIGNFSYYRKINDIIKINYSNLFKVILFKCDWANTSLTGIKQDEFGYTVVNFSRLIHTGQKLQDDPFVFSSQVEPIFYIQDAKKYELEFCSKS
ncbi:hypothetical protein MA16_Dca028255 [Dendrobium catenatum]|uniref:DUF4216 domain-containing protein n=1 Tax=Dendrobium catenatum TaxID=906689 RepID=A0A2I0VAU6_9ASPA|nr:hypothetical protein MA16_Dca028255 [Dendrobium catenatum]